MIVGGSPGGYFHIQRTGCSSYLSRVKKADLVAVRVFSLRRSSAGAFVVPFRVLSPVNMTDVLFQNQCLSGMETISSHATKHDLGISQRFFSKFPTSNPRPFYMGVPPGGRGGWTVASLYHRKNFLKSSTDSILVRLIIFWICCPQNVMQTPRTEVHRQRLSVPFPKFVVFFLSSGVNEPQTQFMKW